MVKMRNDLEKAKLFVYKKRFNLPFPYKINVTRLQAASKIPVIDLETIVKQNKNNSFYLKIKENQFIDVTPFIDKQKFNLKNWVFYTIKFELRRIFSSSVSKFLSNIFNGSVLIISNFLFNKLNISKNKFPFYLIVSNSIIGWTFKNFITDNFISPYKNNIRSKTLRIETSLFRETVEIITNKFIYSLPSLRTLVYYPIENIIYFTILDKFYYKNSKSITNLLKDNIFKTFTKKYNYNISKISLILSFSLNLLNIGFQTFLNRKIIDAKIDNIVSDTLYAPFDFRDKQITKLQNLADQLKNDEPIKRPKDFNYTSSQFYEFLNNDMRSLYYNSKFRKKAELNHSQRIAIVNKI
ncbi:MAG: hypothetical protein J0H68_01985 [Sphingobacteriia bacterium]|nr:hypothetical protein [Sphingobacteriia bacterium]